MRYTTIIDITEVARVWRNPHASMLYLYMTLRCGYHDDDRDTITLSLRDIAWRLHITFSAARHAVRTLILAKLVIQTAPSTYRVVKYVEPKEISSTASQARTRSLEEEARRTGKTVFMITWERMYAIVHKGKKPATEEQREWLHRHRERYRQELQQWEKNRQ